MYGVWFSDLDDCDEGFVCEVGGNGRVRTMVFADEEEAEEQCRREALSGDRVAFFATPYPVTDQVAWRAEWEAARERVRVRARLGH